MKNKLLICIVLSIFISIIYAALYFLFQGEYSGRGPHPKYGEKLNFDMAESQLKGYFVEEQKQKDGSIDRIYQIKNMLHKYQVRYQIEFNFRDARQFFGLSNFKNIKKQQVQNVIGYAFFMVTLSNILLFEIKQKYPDSKFSIQDLKAYFRAEKYLNELLNKDELTASFFQ